MNGYMIVCPFRLEDGSVIMVNRGWVPLKLRETNSRPAEPDTPQDIVGVLRTPERANQYTPDNNARMNEWYNINIEQMTQHGAPGKPAGRFFVQLLDIERTRACYENEIVDSYPIKSVKSDFFYWYVMPETHLGYAMFWFGSFGIFGTAFIFALLKRI
jgi:cytochrome oxidase assembly protein ShyY1